MLTLDHLEPITLDAEAAQRHIPELRALGVLRSGLARLYQVVLGPETAAAAEFPNRFVAGSPSPFDEKFDMDLIACSFNWYAVSACSYAQIIGSINAKEAEGWISPRDYVRAVLPSVRAWRDRLDDSDGLRIAAAVAPIGLMAGRFITAPLPDLPGPKLSPWSLTHIHQQLTQRYWPDPAG